MNKWRLWWLGVRFNVAVNKSDRWLNRSMRATSKAIAYNSKAKEILSEISKERDKACTGSLNL
jgi:hypothetical protein